MWTVIPIHKAFCPYLELQVEHIFKHSFFDYVAHAWHVVPGFFLRVLWHSQSGRNSQNNLAKFGYILDMKVEKNRIFFTLGTLLEINYKNWKFERKPFQNLANLGHFFPWEILCIGWNHFFKETWLYGLSWHFINQDPCPSSGMFLSASKKILVWINACWSRRIIGTHITRE